jgi:hypothetical protein
MRTQEHLQKDLVLFATNTGQFYQRHLDLGRDGQFSKWQTHVEHKVVPLYRKETSYNGPVRIETMTRVAIDLMDYYREHLKEF